MSSCFINPMYIHVSVCVCVRVCVCVPVFVPERDRNRMKGRSWGVGQKDCSFASCRDSCVFSFSQPSAESPPVADRYNDASVERSWTSGGIRAGLTAGKKRGTLQWWRQCLTGTDSRVNTDHPPMLPPPVFALLIITN